MNKAEIQQRVLQNGKPLALSKFTWCEKTNTFSSDEDCLVIDFSNMYGCTITCESYCTITCGSNCTITCGAYCTITCGSNCTITCWYNCTITCGAYCTITCGAYCTITCGYNCTITCGAYCTITCESNCTITCWYECAIINRNVFEVIKPKENDIIQTCPFEIDGHLVNGVHSMTGKQSIIADGILSEVIKKKGNVYKVINRGETGESYLVQEGENFAHGKTLKEAKEALIYKISNRDTSKYDSVKLDDKFTLKEFIKMYITITGACGAGTKYFIESKGLSIDKEYTVQQIIDITEGQYGNETFKQFFNK